MWICKPNQYNHRAVTVDKGTMQVCVHVQYVSAVCGRVLFAYTYSFFWLVKNKAQAHVERVAAKFSNYSYLWVRKEVSLTFKCQRKQDISTKQWHRKHKLVMWSSKEEINLPNSVIAPFVWVRQASPCHRLLVYVDISFTLTIIQSAIHSRNKT